MEACRLSVTVNFIVTERVVRRRTLPGTNIRPVDGSLVYRSAHSENQAMATLSAR